MKKCGQLYASFIRVAQDLHRVTDCDAGFLLRKVNAELAHASDVSSSHDFRTAIDDGFRLRCSETSCDLGLVDIVSPRASTAKMGVGQFQKFEPRHGTEQLAWFVAHALRIREVACILVGNPAFPPLRKTGNQTALGEERRHVLYAMAKHFCPLRLRLAGEDEMVFVQPAPASGGISNYGIHVRRKRMEIPPGEFPRAIDIAHMPR